MKKQNPFSLILMLLQVIILTSATNSFAYSKPNIDLDSRQGEFFKADQNKKAVLFEESISKTSFQISSENENDFFHFHSNLPFEYGLSVCYSESQLSSEYQPNRRNILKIQIFPFHSFW